jgi:hypothetical protein
LQEVPTEQCRCPPLEQVGGGGCGCKCGCRCQCGCGCQC